MLLMTLPGKPKGVQGCSPLVPLHERAVTLMYGLILFVYTMCFSNSSILYIQSAELYHAII